MRILVVVALLCASFLALSQPPIPSSANPTSQAERNGEADQHAAAAPLPATNTLGDQPQPNRKIEETPDYTSHEWWLVYLTALLCCITGGLAWYTARLWGSTKEMAGDAKQNSRAQIRAYVGVENVRIFGLAGGEPLRVLVHLKNFGLTPATDVHHTIELHCDDVAGVESRAVPALTDLRAETRSKAILPPQTHITVVIDDGPTLDSYQAADLAAGERAICVHGTIYFRDIFSELHSVPLRFEVGGTHGISKHPEGGYFLSACNPGKQPNG